MTERGSDVSAGRGSELEHPGVDRVARFVGVGGNDAIAIGLQHFRAIDLQGLDIDLNDLQ